MCKIWWKVIVARIWWCDEIEWQKARIASSMTLCTSEKMLWWKILLEHLRGSKIRELSLSPTSQRTDMRAQREVAPRIILLCNKLLLFCWEGFCKQRMPFNVTLSCNTSINAYIASCLYDICTLIVHTCIICILNLLLIINFTIFFYSAIQKALF